MHHIYHTEALILESKNKGEANRSFTLFTRELGVIHAQAQGVRHLKSKLRYALQDLNKVRIDLVRGKEVWRITSATWIHSYDDIKKDSHTFACVVRISQLIKRLCAGEGDNIPLYEKFLSGLSFLEKHSFTSEEIADAEVALVLSLLYELGYIEKTHITNPFIETMLDHEVISRVRPIKKVLVAEVNRGIHESHM